MATAHSFEPEFVVPPPRPIPDALRSGPYAQKRRSAIFGFAIAGAGCLALAQLPFVQRFAPYLLPLGYLDWIGLALLGVAAASLVDRALRPGPFRYVRDGVPVPARITQALMVPAQLHQGSPVTHAFAVLAEVERPGSGELIEVELRSEAFASSHREAYALPFRIGDTVTAVYLPEDFERTLRLYPFLQLNPAHTLRRPGSDSRAMNLAKLALVIGVVFAPLWVLMSVSFVYEPIDDHFRAAAPYVVPIGLGVGGGLLVWMFWAHRRERRKRALGNLKAMIEGTTQEVTLPIGGPGLMGFVLRALIVVGMPFMGCVFAYEAATLANGWLDRSAAHPVPAHVEGTSAETHALLVRFYQLEYTLVGSEKRHKMYMSPETLEGFRSEKAVARLREGRFGWAWVEDVVPAESVEARAAR